MFGQNPIRKQNVDDDGRWLDVQSIFATVQGEGPMAGMPCVFLRLWGCNLRCYFCDTDFESNRTILSATEIIGRIEKVMPNRAKLVVITGGEPFRQNIAPLIRHLITQRGLQVQIETAGTLWCPDLERYATVPQSSLTIVCSPKTGKVHPKIAKYCHDWKYLIRVGCQGEDGLPNRSTQKEGKELDLYRPGHNNTIWLQPCEEYVTERISPFDMVVVETRDDIKNLNLMSDQKVTRTLVDKEKSDQNIRLCGELAMKHGYRVSLQLHKYLELP